MWIGLDSRSGVLPLRHSRRGDGEGARSGGQLPEGLPKQADRRQTFAGKSGGIEKLQNASTVIILV